MKILLISPSYFYPPNARELSLSLPLGPMYIAAVLERETDFSVSIFDCRISNGTKIKDNSNGVYHGVSDNYFKSIIEEESPDVVGITCMFSSQFDNSLHSAKLVKEVDSNIFIVGGGPHFSVEKENFLLDNPVFDCFITGEGEVPMMELVQALQTKSSFDNIKGIAYKSMSSNGQSIVLKNEHELQRNMDWIPLPAYHLIDMNLFFEFQKQGLTSRGGESNKRTVSMITSRGCPFNCTFCSIALHMGKPVRNHVSNDVVSHIEYVVNKYGVEHLLFEDDALTFRPARTKEICEGIVKTGIEITWETPNGVRADTLDVELLTSMKNSGCISLTIGTESGDQDTLDNIVRKDLKLETVIEVSKMCKELGISLSSFYIIGFPGETIEKMQNTINFATMLYDKYDVHPQLNIATPLIGTKMYDDVMKDNLLAAELTPHNMSIATSPISGSALISTPEFSPDDVKDLSKILYNQINKLRIKKALTSYKTFIYFLKMAISQPQRIPIVIKKSLLSLG